MNRNLLPEKYKTLTIVIPPVVRAVIEKCPPAPKHPDLFSSKFAPSNQSVTVSALKSNKPLEAANSGSMFYPTYES